MDNHNHIPEAGTLLTVVSILLNVVDIKALDAAYFEPLAHLAAAASGFTAVVMFIVNYKKSRNEKTKRKTG
jgi:hypothetical protein